MTNVDEAFEKMCSNAEVTEAERKVVIRRRETICEVLEATWDIDRTFLTGSYDRHTKIKPLEDVDIFMVVDPKGAQAYLRDQAPRTIISELQSALHGKFKRVAIDGMAVRIHMSDDDGQATFEVVPAFEHSAAGFEVPDPDRGRWIRTDPNEHAKLTSKKNDDCDGMWVPFAKMLKCWNYEVGKAIPQSFLIEVMALDLVRAPFGRYQDETAAFFGNLIDTYDGPWPDPADLGPAIDELLTSTDRDAILSAARTCSDIAEEAVYLEDQREERRAVEKWRDLRFANASTMTETASEHQRLCRAYSQRYQSESHRRRFTFVVDVTFAFAAGLIGVSRAAGLAEHLADNVSTWIPLVALLWLVVRESGVIVGPQPHRVDAARIQEQLDLTLWKGTDWRDSWNDLLAGEPVPSTKITRFADGHPGKLADDYFVDTTGCSPARGAALRISQTASWGATDHRRYGILNQVSAIAGALLLILAAYIADWSTRDTSTTFLAIAPLLVGRFQSFRSHDSLASRREALEGHARKVAQLPAVADAQVRTMQDELFRLRTEDRRIPTWVYNWGQTRSQRTIDSDVAQLATRVCRDHPVSTAGNGLDQ